MCGCILLFIEVSTGRLNRIIEQFGKYVSVCDRTNLCINFKEENKAFRKLDKAISGILAVTYGQSGAIISDGRFLYKTGIFKNKKVIDRTGAGDAFGSGFVARLIKGDIKEAIRLGLANAASVVEKIGANKGALTRREFKNDKRWSKILIKIEEI